MQGNWLGQWPGDWQGDGQEAAPGSISGVATMRLALTGDLTAAQTEEPADQLSGGGAGVLNVVDPTRAARAAALAAQFLADAKRADDLARQAIATARDGVKSAQAAEIEPASTIEGASTVAVGNSAAVVADQAVSEQRAANNRRRAAVLAALLALA